MKTYKIKCISPGNRDQVAYIRAKNQGEARQIFLSSYSGYKIKTIYKAA